jgi:hypothetical protein
MNEKDMEDLISLYPDDFFPQKGFILKGRQRSFAGIGRFDLLFEDRFQTKILMELKAVAAKYEVATQLAKYKDELQSRGETHILMWLVAPQIPTSVREFMDRIGIEYTEIHLVEFRRVAERHGFPISSEASEKKPSNTQNPESPTGITRTTRAGPSPSQVHTGPTITRPSNFRWKAYGYDLALVNHEAFDPSTFGRLIDAFERAVPSRRNATIVEELRRWAANPKLAHWQHKSNASLLRWVTTSSYKSAVPHALAIWKYLFGEPAPAWYIWTQAKGYEFYPEKWTTWFESMNPR